jgi:hypothetical protein
MADELTPSASATIDLDEIAELDRRWAAVEAGEPTVPPRRSRAVAKNLGHSGVQTVE